MSFLKVFYKIKKKHAQTESYKEFNEVLERIQRLGGLLTWGQPGFDIRSLSGVIPETRARQKS